MSETVHKFLVLAAPALACLTVLGFYSLAT